jgi:hypothetical protein
VGVDVSAGIGVDEGNGVEVGVSVGVLLGSGVRVGLGVKVGVGVDVGVDVAAGMGVKIFSAGFGVTKLTTTWAVGLLLPITPLTATQPTPSCNSTTPKNKITKYL